MRYAARVALIASVALLPFALLAQQGPSKGLLTPGTAVRARVRTTPAQPVGTWTSWAVELPGGDWEEHDEQAVWEEIDD